MPTAPRLGSLAVLFTLVAACSPTATPADAGESSKREERPPLVRAEPVVRRQIQRKIRTTSYLEAHHSVMLISRVTGRVLEVKTDEGQRVTKGQVLALLDAREITATLEQVQIQLAEKKVRHALSQLESEATLHRQSQAETELKKTCRDLERLQQLDPELVSPRDLDDAEYARSQADDALKVAQFNSRKAKLDVGVAAQTVKELTAKSTEVAIKLKEHQILAPIDGVVSQRLIKGGEAITTASELFEVVDTSILVAYLDRPQRELAIIENAKKVLFTTDAYPERQFSATVDVIIPVVDRQTGSFRIRIAVDAGDAKVLRPGLFINAEILTEDNRSAIMIPKTAVLAEGEDSVVFFIRDPLGDMGKARRLKLDTGIEDDTSIECRNRGARALREGDLIIVSGHQDLKDQTEVQLSKN